MRRRLAVTGLVGACALAAVGCGNTPTEITPLPRSIGEVQAVLLELSDLKSLDPSSEGVYNLWALLERNQTQHLGQFYIDVAGNVVDASGNSLREFRSDNEPLRKALGILISVEGDGPAPDNPGGMQILSGTVIDGVATLSVPIPSAIRDAAGSLRVFTPTDGPGTNESSGVWMMDLAGQPSLDLPDTTAALIFELIVDLGGTSLNIGQFDRADQADNFCRFCADAVAPPAVPGDDFLVNPPEGLTFPANLSGARVTVSLEARRGDFVTRSQLVVLEAFIPAGVAGDTIVPFVNRAGSFPTGRAVLY